MYPHPVEDAQYGSCRSHSVDHRQWWLWQWRRTPSSTWTLLSLTTSSLPQVHLQEGPRRVLGAADLCLIAQVVDHLPSIFRGFFGILSTCTIMLPHSCQRVRSRIRAVGLENIEGPDFSRLARLHSPQQQIDGVEALRQCSPLRSRWEGCFKCVIDSIDSMANSPRSSWPDNSVQYSRLRVDHVGILDQEVVLRRLLAVRIRTKLNEVAMDRDAMWSAVVSHGCNTSP